MRLMLAASGKCTLVVVSLGILTRTLKPRSRLGCLVGRDCSPTAFTRVCGRCQAFQKSGSLFPSRKHSRIRVRGGGTTIVEPWAVLVSDDEQASGRLCEKTVCTAAEILKSKGFVILRGGSVFAEEELIAAQRVATNAFCKVRDLAEQLGLRAMVPWRCHEQGVMDSKMFKFQEAVSYSSGRLDMAISAEQASQQPVLRSHPDIVRVATSVFGKPCELCARGSFWNFPGSGPPHWHRDGNLPLLTAVTAAEEYPANAGFIDLQPYTHMGAQLEHVGSHESPLSLDDVAIIVPSILRRGETLLFFYTTKHAATPNFSTRERCLLYSNYGPMQTYDDINLKPCFPALTSYTREEAEILLSLAQHVQCGGVD